MQFEYMNALWHLNERTPAYLLREIFHHGNTQVRDDALKALADLDTRRKSVRILREILKIA